MPTKREEGGRDAEERGGERAADIREGGEDEPVGQVGGIAERAAGGECGGELPSSEREDEDREGKGRTPQQEQLREGDEKRPPIQGIPAEGIGTGFDDDLFFPATDFPTGPGTNTDPGQQEDPGDKIEHVINGGVLKDGRPGEEGPEPAEQEEENCDRQPVPIG